MNGRLTQQDLEKVGRRLSGHGITLRCEGDKAFADIAEKKITIPAIPDAGVAAGEMLDTVRFFIDHECGHMVGNSDTELLVDIQKRFRLAGKHILNTLEDVRVEALMSGLWSGCGVNLDKGRERLVNKIVAKMPFAEYGWLVQQVGLAIYRRGSGLPAIPGWYPDAFDAPAIERIIGTDGDDPYRIGEIGQWAKSTADLVPVAEAILHKLADEMKPKQSDEPESEDEPEDQSEGKSEGKSEGDSEGKSEGASEDESEGASEGASGAAGAAGADGDGDGQREDGSGPSAGAATLTDDDVSHLNSMTNPHNQPMLVDDAAKQSLMGMQTDASTTGGLPLCSMYPDVNESDEQIALLDRGTSARIDRKRINDACECVGGAARQRLVQSLQCEDRVWWSGGRKAGSPDPARLAALAAGTSDRVMRSRRRYRSLSTAVSLLMDGSGSMDEHPVTGRTHAPHRPRDRAAEVAAAVGSALQAGGIRCELSAFTGHYDIRSHRTPYPQVAILKGFGQRMDAKARERLRAFTGMRSGGTPLASAMWIAGHRLLRQSAERRVLLVQTDGYPDSNEYKMVRPTMDYFERNGVEVVLIGIFTTSVRDFTDKYTIVQDLSDLGAKTMRELQKHLHVARSGAA